ETGYFDMAGAMPDGKLRQANLRLMIQKAEGYEEANFHGLFNFIKYVERIKTTGTDIGEAKTDAGEENSVSLMTVHKSKGLEYPVVFVAGLGKQFNKRDATKNVLMHQTLGFGIKKFDYKKRVVYETAARRLISETITREGLSEELRILYVALTRARDKLFLVGTVPDIKKKAAKWSACMFFDKLPYHHLLKAASYIDWLGPCIMRHKAGRELLEMSGIDVSVFKERISTDASEWEINFIDDIFTDDRKIDASVEDKADNKMISADVIERIVDNVKWRYPFENASIMPANVSISELKRIWQEKFEGDEGDSRQFADERGFEYPSFMDEGEVVSSSRKGTVMHALMEQLDFKADINEEAVKAAIDSMKAKGLIKENEARTVRIEKVIRFFNTDISRRMKKSLAVYKEEPFAMTLESKEAFGERYEDINEKVLLHGIIDCYFEEEDGLVLIDYKTDRVRDKEEIRRRYKIQLDMYKKAIEKATGKNVKEVYIYLFDTDEFMDMR
ncbi:MAG: PD-(D/E)XK nuclease family protein, partial [Firmicutes bacterium]|nr:PD-(D/E)XK nuclease family protein [Bacillota bacterium]